MLQMTCAKEPGARLKVLCLGAHSDDIEIGCGGTILQLIREYRNIEFFWVIFGANDNERRQEAVQSAELLLEKVENKTIVVKAFEDTCFPFAGKDIKNFFQEIKASFQPDLIFTHYRHDLHQDHRIVSEFTWNTFRDHLILEYEIPKYDGDVGTPNFFSPIDDLTAKKKICHLLTNFKTQHSKPWFTVETFQALLCLRGLESGGQERYAEAFYSRKLLCQW
ncbi:MAG: PIG-L family deacetylase [Nitrospiraceae bacterium]|nr:PIG-L family deacetylase [Nitrospira sp.]MCA9455874.1 PIG-L family deacetylase [Nitrospira sp.]MCB9775712.1 PIG-L family deacetylase [Nitrospiraceae bacterium]